MGLWKEMELKNLPDLAIADYGVLNREFYRRYKTLRQKCFERIRRMGILFLEPI